MSVPLTNTFFNLPTLSITWPPLQGHINKINHCDQSVHDLSSGASSLLAPTQISRIHLTELFTLSRFAFIRGKGRSILRGPSKSLERLLAVHPSCHTKRMAFFYVLSLSCMSSGTLSVFRMKSSSSKLVTQRSKIMTYCISSMSAVHHQRK